MATESTSRTRPILIAIVFFILLIAIGYGVRSLFRSKTVVRTATVSYADLTSTTSTNGKVEPTESFEAHASAPAVVKHIYVDDGQSVKKGSLLMQLEDEDALARLASAQTSLASAEASSQDVQTNGSQDERIALQNDLSHAQLQVEQAQKSVTALQQLQQKGAASAGEVTSAQQRLQSAQISLQTLQQRTTNRYSPTDKLRVNAQVNDGRAAVTAAKKIVADANIHAPFTGTVYSIPVQEYDFVPAGETLISMANLNTLQVRAYFDEPEIGKLKTGQPVKIVWEAKPGVTWHGHIILTPTTIINYGTRSVGEAFITVDDAHGDLLPNTNVIVTVTTLQHPHVLSVPREALHQQDGESYVFRIVDGKLVRTPVVTDAINLVQVEIVSGLKEGDTVVLSSADNSDLSSGQRVTVAP